MDNKEEIEVLYNDCYGGWTLSNKAKELYKLRKNNLSNAYISKRSDPILIQIYNELGDKFDDKFSKTNIKKIDKIYEKYYDIEEYDGLESVIINYDKYNLDKIKNKINEILQSNINNDEKIGELEKFMYNFE